MEREGNFSSGTIARADFIIGRGADWPLRPMADHPRLRGRNDSSPQGLGDFDAGKFYTTIYHCEAWYDGKYCRFQAEI